MKIYTKTGDNGTTRLVDGTCVDKFNPRVEAYGTVDELNSYLGLISSQLKNEPDLQFQKQSVFETIQRIQNNLFVVGSLLATADETVAVKLPQLGAHETESLELLIDEMTEQLPELKNFILPTGHVLASHFHIARTLCRRAERRTAEITKNEKLNHLLLIYLNRLSDFLFVSARFVNHKKNQQDILWTKN